MGVTTVWLVESLMVTYKEYVFFVMTSLKASVEAFRQLDPANTRTALKDISGRAILTARQTKPTSKMPDGSK